MTKLKTINVEEVSYITFRNWLTEVSFKKGQLQKYKEERLEKQRKAIKLREQLSELQADIRLHREREDKIIEELMQAIPNKF